MKTFTIVGAAALLLAAKFTFFPCDCGKGATEVTQVSSVAHASEPAGNYLEARNVTLWGGYCHLNGEHDTYGDGAIVAWDVERGAHQGVDLAGVRVVAAIGSPKNLADGAERTSELWIDAPSESARKACAAWLGSAHADQLGDVVAVHAAPVAFARAGDAFRVAVAGVCSVEGEAMSDRSCCSMPEQRGYEPLMADAGAVVGVAQNCVFEGTANLTGWEFADANSVFVEGFGPKDACCASGACAAHGDGGTCPHESTGAHAPKGCCPTSRSLQP